MFVISIKELFKIIKADFRRYDPKVSISKFVIYGLLGIGPFQCVLIYRLAYFFRINKVPFLHVILTKINMLLHNAEISAYSNIKEGLFIAHTSGIVIGKNVNIGINSIIFHQVTIGAKTPFDGKELMPNIGDEVKIYTGAKILGGIVISDRCRIGANVVVTTNLNTNTTIVEDKNNYIQLKGEN